MSEDTEEVQYDAVEEEVVDEPIEEPVSDLEYIRQQLIAHDKG
jgi:hypothetical protein